MHNMWQENNVEFYCFRQQENEFADLKVHEL